MRVISILTVLICGLCFPEARAQEQGTFCEAGSNALVEYTTRNPFDPDQSIIYGNCGVGDTVMIPAQYQRLIARACDYSKTALVVGDSVICVVGPPKAVK